MHAAEVSDYGRKVVHAEAEAVRGVASRLDESFVRACRLVAECRGRVIVTGMGKAGIVGQKISATLSSTGAPSLFLHPAEALHGDLGCVTQDDIVLALSNSGETDEIKRLLEPVKEIGATLVAITGCADSTLARHSEVVLDLGKIEEACPFNLAPTASTTAMLALGDAVALTVFKIKDFGPAEFARFHPGGSLGRELVKVSELMRTGRGVPTVSVGATVRQTIVAITHAEDRPTGAACVVDDEGKLVGLFTDGDLRHFVESHETLDVMVSEVMTTEPATIGPDRLAKEALRVMRERRFDELPVIDADGVLEGILDIQDLVAAGFT